MIRCFYYQSKLIVKFNIIFLFKVKITLLELKSILNLENHFYDKLNGKNLPKIT